MLLKDKIKDEIKKALQEKDNFKLSVLRMLNASILNKEKEKRAKIVKAEPDKTEEDIVKESQLTDEEVIEVISSEIKKRKDSIEQYEKGGRADLVKQEKKELEILMSYAPKQMSEDEIRKIAQETIKKMGVSGLQNTGQVMGALISQVKGKADGGMVNKIVQEELKSAVGK